MNNAAQTQAKIIQALDMAANNALERLMHESDISLKEYKEMLGLLIKAAEQIAKYKPQHSEEKIQQLSPTDRLLLERYVQQQRIH